MDDVRTKLDALEKAMQQASASMYQNAQQAGGADTSSNTTSSNDDVVDGEFTEKN